MAQNDPSAAIRTVARVGGGLGGGRRTEEGACLPPLREDSGAEKVGHILNGAGWQYRTNPSSLDKAQGSAAPEGKLEVS